MTEFLVNALGLILMAAIVGWFWLGDRSRGKGSDNASSTSHHH